MPSHALARFRNGSKGGNHLQGAHLNAIYRLQQKILCDKIVRECVSFCRLVGVTSQDVHVLVNRFICAIVQRENALF